MLSQAETKRVYLALGSTDMRTSIDSLSAIVSLQFKLDLFSESLFVFCNRKKDKLKILHWDNNGFWLYYRRLENGRFQWPKADQAGPLAISRRELGWLLDGLTLEQHQAHPPLPNRKIA